VLSRCTPCSSTFQTLTRCGFQSIWGGTFKDEKAGLQQKFTERGVVSAAICRATSCRLTSCAQVAMCNSGKNSNGSQFFITFGPAPQLNGDAPSRLLAPALSSSDHHPRAGKHVVFGKVVSGFEVLEQIEAVGVPAGQDGEPVRTVLIFDCGLLP
jgi:peptidylprolyl isomerase